MRWNSVLLKKCYEVMEVGGEVSVTFVLRKKDDRLYSVPIIKVYKRNQTICDQEEVEIED